MKTLVTLILVFMLVALASPMPKACRGQRCRHLRPTNNGGRNRAPPRAPANKLPPGVVRRPVAKRPPVPVVKPIATTPPTVPEVEQVTEMKMVTDSDGQEVREAGVNGWLAEPTPAPAIVSSISRTDATPINEKPGSCDSPKGFGIMCAVSYDQCEVDDDCPGTTKCCMVDTCGHLCVKPKPVSTGPKEVTKETPSKIKVKGDKVSSQVPSDLTPSTSEISEAVELPEGAVKLEDIIEVPEEMKKKNKEEQEKKKTELKKQDLAGEEQQQEKEKDVQDPAKTKDEEETQSQVEEVVEKLEEVIEEEIELIEEELETTTQSPLDEELETTTEE